MILPAAMALWVATGQLPLATEAELPTGEKVTLAADQLVYEPAKETLIARGHTILQTENISLRADEIVYDQANQRAWAKGNVMFVSGLLAAVAEEVSVDLRSYEAQVKGGLFLRKRNVTQEQLLAAKTPQELKKTGETVLTITGSRIKRVGKNEFLVDDLSFTPCDCDPTEPSWRVEANSAQVEMGERAILTWPVVYVYRLPVFALPWLYLPLSERRTGILVPRPNFSAQTGLSLEQPVFVTLGESYDMTFTPGFYLGAPDPVPSDDPRAAPPLPNAYGIRGGRLHTEFRYVPSEHTSGRATVGLLYDLRNRRNPLGPEEQIDQRRGLRLEASLQHNQNMGNGWRNRVDAGFVSDGYYFRDVTTDVLALQSEYLRSTAVINHRSTMTYFGVDAVVRQPIFTDTQRFGFDLLREDWRLPDGRILRPSHTIARFPAITWSMPERTLAGPLAGSVHVELARLSPVWRTFGDEGADGVFSGSFQAIPQPGTDGPGAWEFRTTVDEDQGNGRFDPGEREARERLDIRPQLSAPLGNRFVRFTPYLGLRETLYFGEVTGTAAHRGYPLAGASLSTTLARSFGSATSGVRHALSPRVEMRYVPFVLGGVPGGKIYDDIDAAVPADGLWQMVAEVRQDLALRTGGAVRDLLRLDLGQGWDLRTGKAADTFGRLGFTYGPVTLSGVARYDLPSEHLPGEFSQISANLNLDNGRGAAIYVSYDRLLAEVGSDPLRAGIDELVGQPLSEVARLRGPGTTFEPAEQVVGGFRALFPFGLGLRYEAIIQPRATRKFPQQLVGVSYGPGCDCWRLEVYGYLRPGGLPEGETEKLLGWPYATPTFGASLTIHQFGSFGAGG